MLKNQKLKKKKLIYNKYHISEIAPSDKKDEMQDNQQRIEEIAESGDSEIKRFNI